MCKHTEIGAVIECGPYAILDPLTGERLCCTVSQCKCSRNSREQTRISDALESAWRAAGIMRGERSEECRTECRCEVRPASGGDFAPRGHYVSARDGFVDCGHILADAPGFNGAWCVMNLLPVLNRLNVADGNSAPYVAPDFPLAAVLDCMYEATLNLIPKTRSSRVR